MLKGRSLQTGFKNTVFFKRGFQQSKFLFECRNSPREGFIFLFSGLLLHNLSSVSPGCCERWRGSLPGALRPLTGLQIFQNGKFRQVRVVERGGILWFVARDV